MTSFKEIDRKAVTEMLPKFCAGCDAFRAETGRSPEFDEALGIYAVAMAAAMQEIGKVTK